MHRLLPSASGSRQLPVCRLLVLPPKQSPRHPAESSHPRRHPRLPEMSKRPSLKGGRLVPPNIPFRDIRLCRHRWATACVPHDGRRTTHAQRPGSGHAAGHISCHPGSDSRRSGGIDMAFLRMAYFPEATSDHFEQLGTAAAARIAFWTSRVRRRPSDWWLAGRPTLGVPGTARSLQSKRVLSGAYSNGRLSLPAPPEVTDFEPTLLSLWTASNQL